MKALIILILCLVLECLAAPKLISADIKEAATTPTESFPNVIHLKEEWTHVSFLKAKPEPSTTTTTSTTQENLIESTTAAQAFANAQKIFSENETPQQQKDENKADETQQESSISPTIKASVVTENPSTTVKPAEEAVTQVAGTANVRSKRSIYNYVGHDFDGQDLEAQSDLQDSRDKRDTSSYDIHDLTSAPQLWSILRPFIEPRFSKYKRDLEQLEKTQHAVHHNYDALKNLFKHGDKQSKLSADNNPEPQHQDHTVKAAGFETANENENAKSFNKAEEETDDLNQSLETTTNTNKSLDNLGKAKQEEAITKSSGVKQKEQSKIEAAKEGETNNEKPSVSTTLARPKPPSVAELFARAQPKTSADK